MFHLLSGLHTEQAACHYMGAKLVEIESAEENEFVANLVQSHANGEDIRRPFVLCP